MRVMQRYQRGVYGVMLSCARVQAASSVSGVCSSLLLRRYKPRRASSRGSKSRAAFRRSWSSRLMHILSRVR